MTRREARHRFDQPVRIDLLEDDVDDLYSLHAEAVAEAKKHTMLLIGLLVSVTTACILMAVNVLTGAA